MTRDLSVSIRKSLSCMMVGLLFVAASASAQVGTFQFVLGDVKVRNAAGVERAAVKGATVNEGDTIVSGATGEAQLLMVDNAFVAVRRNTELRVEQYNYKGRNDGSEAGVLHLVKGTFRALTGLIVRNNKQNFTMKTAVSTIGIRGTGNITNHDPGANVTVNHTVTGSHTVTSNDPKTGAPIGITVVTSPGITVQIQPGQAPKNIPTPSFILAEASKDPKDQPAKKEEAKPAPRSDSLTRAESETRETGTEAPKQEPPAPPPPPSVVDAVVVTQTPEPPQVSASEQQLLQASLRVQLEGLFLQAQGALASANSSVTSAQTSVTNAQTSATATQSSATAALNSAASAAAVAPVDVTPLDTKIAQAQSLLPFATTPADQASMQNSITAAQSSRTTANNAAGVGNTSSSLTAAQTAAQTAATAAAGQVTTAQTAVTTAQTGLTSAQAGAATTQTAFNTANATYQAALAAIDANDIVLAQQLLQQLTTETAAVAAQSAAASAGAQTASTAASTSASAASSSASSATTAANQLTAANTAVSTANTAVASGTTSADAAITVALGNVQAVAQAAASNATAIGGINTALGTASGTTPQQAFNTAGTTNTNAQSLASTISAIAAIDTATASANLASVTTLANTAQSQATTAANVNTANSNVTSGIGGTDFRDSLAGPALTAMNTANTAVQGALTTATGANTTVSAQSAALVTAKTQGATQAGSATTAFNTAQSTFNTLTAAPQVDTGLTNANQTVSNLTTLANTAAANAQTFANLGTQQGALDAQTEYNKTTAYLALAQQIQTVIQQRDAVVTADGQLATTQTSANTAKTTGDAAVASTATALATANTSAPTVAQQSIIAQYNNPAVVTPNRMTSVGRATKQLTGATSNERFQHYAVQKPNTNFVLDGQKSLVESRVTSSIDTDKSGTFNPSLSGSLTVVGGTPADMFIASNNVAGSENYVALGRVTGGLLQANGATVADLGTGAGARSFHWLIGYEPASGYTAATKLTGVTSYAKIGNTNPTDASGNVGTLNSATLSADFTAQTVTAGVNATVAGRTYAATTGTAPVPLGVAGTGTPQFGGNFQTVTCSGTGCSGTYGGDLTGSLTGTKADGAGFVYDLFPSTAAGSPYTDLIQGAVAFQAGTPPALIPQPPANVATAYLYAGGSSATSFQASGTTYTLDGTGNLTQVAEDSIACPDCTGSQTISGGTSPAKSSVTSTSPSATVVDFGRWQGGTVNGVDDFRGSFTDTVAGAYHWMKGPAIGPWYLPMALTGTVNYTGTTPTGMVTDQAGVLGAISASSTLSVNFTTQSVAFDIQATTGAGAWQALGSGVGLEPSGQFHAFTGSTSPHQNMSVTLAGSSTGTFGGVDGALMGNGVDAAGVAFVFGQGATNRAAGTVAFTSSTAQSAATSYVSGIVAAGKLGSPVNTSQAPILSTTLAALNPDDLAFSVLGNINASSRVTRDGASQVTRFDMEVPVAQPTGCTSTCTDVNFAQGTFTLRDSTYPLDPPPSPGGTTPATALTDTGADATTGLRWGRYVGFVSYADRTTGTTSNPAVAAAAFDARTSNWHAIWADAQTAVPVLPATGTFSYTLLGGTRPTDSTGAIAATPATATLSANFTAMTVNASVNTTIGANTWAASASNMPIVKSTFFEAQKVGGAGNLSVTMNGSATGTSGRMTGIFTGNATGATGGAMLGVSMNQGGAAGVTMQSVSAFKK